MVSWGPDLVTLRHDLVTKGEVWAVFLIALGQGKEVYFDYLGFCLLVLVNLRCIIVT